MGEAENLAVVPQERRSGEELAAVLSERPGHDDTVLARIGHAIDTRGHPAEHGLTSPL